MGISTTFTVFCDHEDAYGEWIAEEHRKSEAAGYAREKGWVRQKLSDGRLGWVCPEHRTDVCGDYWSGNEVWCLQKPGHDGKHDWQRA